jgi:hypothetical protein
VGAGAGDVPNCCGLPSETDDNPQQFGLPRVPGALAEPPAPGHRGLLSPSMMLFVPRWL